MNHDNTVFVGLDVHQHSIVAAYAVGLAFEEHRRSVEDRFAQCGRLEQVLQEAAPQWRFYPVIQALQALRGVQFTVALGVIAEVGDLTRFDHPRQLMSWLGIVSSEYSSGTKKRQGPSPSLATGMRVAC